MAMVKWWGRVDDARLGYLFSTDNTPSAALARPSAALARPAGPLT